MCGDMLSSSWETEVKKNKLFNPTDTRNEWLHEPIRSKLKRWQTDAAELEFGAAITAGTVEEIYWVGGEPLMFEQHWDYMQRIIDLGYSDRVYVRYNTNLSRVNYKNHNLWNMLTQFRDWQVCASLDGTGKIGEYIRTGLKYSEWLQNFETGVAAMRHNRQLKIDYTLTVPGLLEIRNMVELSKKYNVELLTKVTFAFSPNVVMTPMALPRHILNEIVDENLEWLAQNADANQQSLIDVLSNMKQRLNLEEQWTDIYTTEQAKGKQFFQTVEKIRKGTVMEDILAKDSRLLNWWNSI
jgi:hypothetical protein